MAIGDINNIPVGSTFADREALRLAGVHYQNQAGIAGRAGEGAESIVLNEGYEDDQDFGDEVVYTGQGGRDPNTGRQIADQPMTLGNRALVTSQLQGIPVRVVRGYRLRSPFKPATGYRYDGLYTVESHWQERGRSGFLVWRYRLRRTDPTAPPWMPPATVVGPAPRREGTVQRIVRNTLVAQRVKELHDFTCQVCGIQIETPDGPYAEAAHIRPLGAPHDGPDSEDNILCLCPNHHVLFDYGGFAIGDDLSLLGLPGRLRTVAGHHIDVQHAQYHRDRFVSITGVDQI